MRSAADAELSRAARDAAPLLILVVPTVFGGLLQIGSLIPGGLPLPSWGRWSSLLRWRSGGVLRWLGGSPPGDPVAVRRAKRCCSTVGFGVDALQPPRRAAGTTGGRMVVAGDGDVVDAYARAAGRPWGGTVLRRVQNGVTTTYLTWLVAGVVVRASRRGEPAMSLVLPSSPCRCSASAVCCVGAGGWRPAVRRRRRHRSPASACC